MSCFKYESNLSFWRDLTIIHNGVKVLYVCFAKFRISFIDEAQFIEMDATKELKLIQ